MISWNETRHTTVNQRTFMSYLDITKVRQSYLPARSPELHSSTFETGNHKVEDHFRLAELLARPRTPLGQVERTISQVIQRWSEFFDEGDFYVDHQSVGVPFIGAVKFTREHPSITPLIDALYRPLAWSEPERISEFPEDASFLTATFLPGRVIEDRKELLSLETSIHHEIRTNATSSQWRRWREDPDSTLLQQWLDSPSVRQHVIDLLDVAILPKLETSNPVFAGASSNSMVISGGVLSMISTYDSHLGRSLTRRTVNWDLNPDTRPVA